MLDVTAPVLVGGHGGSGTRVVARLLEQLGVWLPPPLNETWDNMALERGFRNDALPAAVAELQMAAAGYDGTCERWGAKVITNMLFLPELVNLWPNMRYVHVQRHPLDVVFHPDQQHLPRYYWSRWEGGYAGTVNSAPERLDFWMATNDAAVHSRIPKTIVRFEELLSDAGKQAHRLAAFCGLVVADEGLDLSWIKTPESVGRYKEHDLRVFYQKQIDELRKLGYEVEQAALASGGENTLATEAAMNAPTGPD